MDDITYKISKIITQAQLDGFDSPILAATIEN